MTQSLLEYGITAWGGLGIAAQNKLLIAQNSIIKIILSKSKTYSSKKLFKEFKQITRTTHQNNKIIIPTIKTLF
ncbi:neuroblastoma-amplified sequence-like [Aphis craccivora]|uniref:Neuroblastoma-amplified sequence-like n=1 Tax=Aphis craccivora TaxID=307492 RepID=A0A6G0ZEK3_APHCR|nr:neuroblastoma-amplified sequence-like [Aphis craccivora]